MTTTSSAPQEPTAETAAQVAAATRTQAWRGPRRAPPRPNATSTYPVERWDAARVRRLREHLKWTQYEMAQRFHVRQQTISEWETGKYTPRGRSLVVLTALARRYLFPADGSSPEPSATEPATALAQGAERLSATPDAPDAPDAPVGDDAS